MRTLGGVYPTHRSPHRHPQTRPPPGYARRPSSSSAFGRPHGAVSVVVSVSIRAFRPMRHGPWCGILACLYWEDFIESAGVLFIVVVLAVMFISGFIASSIAESKGRSGLPFFVLAFFVPLVGILVAALMPPVEPVGQSQSSIGLEARDAPLATLRPTGDRQTTAFLRDYHESMNVALRSCDLGESVLAYGRGVWGSRRAVFVLTDQQFVIVADSASRAQSIRGLDGITLTENQQGLLFPDGVLKPLSSSPFSATEVAARIRQRGEPLDFVEMIGPGEVAPLSTPAPAEPVEPASDVIGDVERLDALHRSGAIDDDEFAELKRRAMWGDD
jgi:hypothetical protein